MWKLWKSASNPYAASKTALENKWKNRVVFHSPVHIRSHLRGTANTISLFKAAFPAMRHAKPFDKRVKNSC